VRAGWNNFRAMVAGFEIEEVNPKTQEVTAGPTALPAADASLKPSSQP
jgi:hypothetical protein